MAGRRGVLVGERPFATKAEAIQYLQELRDKYGPGNSVTDADDQVFLSDLVAMHPDAEQKIGAGIDHFEIRRNGPTVGFWIVRVDQTDTDFSFLRSLRAPSHAEEVRAAMRQAVIDQKIAARDAEFAKGEVRCPVTNELLTPETSHVHHADREFVDLADDFAEIVGGYDGVEVVAGDGAIGRRLASEELTAQWQGYHRETAHLVVVSKRANLSDLRRGRPRR